MILESELSPHIKFRLLTEVEGHLTVCVTMRGMGTSSSGVNDDWGTLRLHPALRPRCIFSPRLPLNDFLQVEHIFNFESMVVGGKFLIGGILLGGSGLIVHLLLDKVELFDSTRAILSRLLELSSVSLTTTLDKSSSLMLGGGPLTLQESSTVIMGLFVL